MMAALIREGLNYFSPTQLVPDFSFQHTCIHLSRKPVRYTHARTHTHIYNYIHQNLPLYFLYNNYITYQTSHNYGTRQRNTYIHYVKHTFAQKYLRYSITKVINTCPTSITDKIYTFTVLKASPYILNIISSHLIQKTVIS